MELIRALLGGSRRSRPDAHGWLSARDVKVILPKAGSRWSFKNDPVLFSADRSTWRVETEPTTGRWRLAAEIDGELKPIIRLVEGLDQVLTQWNDHRAMSRGASGSGRMGGGMG